MFKALLQLHQFQWVLQSGQRLSLLLSISTISLPPAPHPASPTAPQCPSPPPVQPAEPVRCSMRSRVPAETWQQSWFKAGYNPQDHLVPPQPAPPDPLAQQYRDPTPQIPSSDEEDDPE